MNYKYWWLVDNITQAEDIYISGKISRENLLEITSLFWLGIKYELSWISGDTFSLKVHLVRKDMPPIYENVVLKIMDRFHIIEYFRLSN